MFNCIQCFRCIRHEAAPVVHFTTGSFEDLPNISMKQLIHSQSHSTTYFENAANMGILSHENTFMIKRNTIIW